MLEEVAIASTCDNMDTLPAVTFILGGTPYTLQPADYVMMGQMYDEVSQGTPYSFATRR